MADKKFIDAMWDDSPIDVSSEVNFIWSIANKLRYMMRFYEFFKDIEIVPQLGEQFEMASGKVFLVSWRQLR